MVLVRYDTDYQFSVARIESSESGTLFRSTGFLVPPDLVLTALHAVADSLVMIAAFIR